MFFFFFFGQVCEEAIERRVIYIEEMGITEYETLEWLLIIGEALVAREFGELNIYLF